VGSPFSYTLGTLGPFEVDNDDNLDYDGNPMFYEVDGITPLDKLRPLNVIQGQIKIFETPVDDKEVVRLEDLGPLIADINFNSNYPADSIQVGGANLLWSNDSLDLLASTQIVESWTACHPSAIIVGSAEIRWNYAQNMLEIWIGGAVVQEWDVAVAVAAPEVIWTYDAGTELKIGWAWFKWNATSSELELWLNGAVAQSWGG
jgi:hypothetical protein